MLACRCIPSVGSSLRSASRAESQYRPNGLFGLVLLPHRQQDLSEHPASELSKPTTERTEHEDRRYHDPYPSEDRARWCAATAPRPTNAPPPQDGNSGRLAAVLASRVFA
jgi:hypothetical protein